MARTLTSALYRLKLDAAGGVPYVVEMINSAKRTVLQSVLIDLTALFVGDNVLFISWRRTLLAQYGLAVRTEWQADGSVRHPVSVVSVQ